MPIRQIKISKMKRRGALLDELPLCQSAQYTLIKNTI